MAHLSRTVKIFISSPGDVAEERAAALEILTKLGGDPSFQGRLHLQAVTWDDAYNPAPLRADMRPQDAVNLYKVPPADCDIVIGILRARIGTPPWPDALSGHRRADGSPYLSGTDWELRSALAASAEREARGEARTPVVLLYRAQPTRLRPFRAVTRFIDDLKHYPRAPLLGDVSMFNDIQSFRDRLEQELRPILEHIKQQVGPPDSDAKLSEMEELVRRYGICQDNGRSLVTCAYHRDRAEIGYHEQSDTQGEIELGDGQIKLLPEPPVMELFQRFRMRSGVAGHFGLVARQRRWLRDSVKSCTRMNSASEQVAILQTGTAGPVHHFGTVKVLRQALDDLGYHGRVHTIDQCITPLLLCQAVDAATSQLRDAAEKGAPLEVTLRGQRFEFDRSFAEIIEHLEERQDRNLTYATGDLADEDALDHLRDHFDLVISHFILSMWGNSLFDRLPVFCANLATALKSGGHVLLAAGENRHSRDIQRVHQVFEAHGFRCVEVSRTWDPYGLDEQSLAWAAAGKPVTVRMGDSMCRYMLY